HALLLCLSLLVEDSISVEKWSRLTGYDDRARMTTEEQIHNRIEELVAEEHELYSRVGEGGLSAAEHNRLESIKVSLDQAWDLLRQRRALRESGQDPEAAHARDPEVVEGYEQ